MSSSLNLVVLIGRLGKDPELRYTAKQVPVCTLNLATSEHWKDQAGQKQETTHWHRVVVWGTMGENCANFLKKGSSVHVVGKLTTRSYEDQKGMKRFVTEIKADDVGFLGTKPQQPVEELPYEEEAPF